MEFLMNHIFFLFNKKIRIKTPTISKTQVHKFDTDHGGGAALLLLDMHYGLIPRHG